VANCVHCGAAVPDRVARCPACGKPPQKSGIPKPLIIGLVALGCIPILIGAVGIVAALVIPNFIDALQKAKQKRTVADLQAIAVALDGRAADQPAGAPPYPAVETIDELAAELAPYGTVVTMDGWKHPLRYACWPDLAADGCHAYRLASAGRDGVFDHDELGSYETAPFDPIEYDADIVLATDGFVRWPERPR